MLRRLMICTATVVAGAALAPVTAHAIPTCTTISVVMLPGYQCRLGGLLFDGFDFFADDQGLLLSAPASYDLVFGWTGNRVTLAFRPIGSTLLTASGTTGLGVSAGGFGVRRFTYNLSVDPTAAFTQVLGASAQFGPVSATVSDPNTESYAMVLSGFYNSLGGSASGGFRQYASPQPPPFQNGPFGSNLCGPGGANIANNPLSTGNTLCSSFGIGSTVQFGSYVIVGATAEALYSGQFPPASATASIHAGWSNTFTTNFSAVPEPQTVALLSTGLIAIGLGSWRRRKRTV